MNDIIFDYYRGVEAEQYSFYRIPKMLFTDTIFQDLSCEAKVLYGLMLDRMSLSLKNHWMDEEERVYIIFTVNNICDLMNCGTQKAVRLLKELDVKTGIGLIEKKRLGLGKPNVIYVKNFMIKDEEGEKQQTEQKQSRIVHQKLLNPFVLLFSLDFYQIFGILIHILTDFLNFFSLNCDFHYS